MVVRYFGCQATQCLVRGGKRRGLPISHERMDICINLLLIGYFGFDLDTEIVRMCLVSIITIVFGGNDHC
jgi:hypothetical protein